MLERFVRIR